MQSRSTGGREVLKQFLTPDTLTASYPVIIPAGDKNAVVAYSVKKGIKEFIQYQTVGL